MSAIAYVNEAYLPLSEAAVSIQDRGYQFADGVYEVFWVENRRIIDLDAHFDRLEQSLAKLQIEPSLSRSVLGVIIKETVRRNRLVRGFIYLQITRGVAPRHHLFPLACDISLVVTAQAAEPPSAAMMETGVAVITMEDIRWKRCDIKAISLLPNVLGKQKAANQSAFEAWQIDPESGLITEGAASNAWIIDADYVLRTHPSDDRILGGIVRQNILRLAADLDIPLSEKAFTIQDVVDAREAFLTSTTNFVLPVTRINTTPIADGRPGPKTRNLMTAYAAHIAESAHG